MKMDALENLREAIEVAFTGIRRPSDKDIPKSSEYRDVEEVKDFLGRNWRDWKSVPRKVINQNFGSLYFLSNKAFAFFLPSFLLAALESPGETFWIVGRLKVPGTTNAFSAPQRVMIAEFLIQYKTQVQNDRPLNSEEISRIDEVLNSLS